MNFLKKGIEYNRIANAFSQAFVALNNYDGKVNSGLNNDYYELKQDLLILAFLCRRDILEKIEEFGWAMTSPITVPMISRSKISLLFAYQQTIGKLLRFADQIKIKDEIQEIIEKGESYEAMKILTPNKLKFQSALLGKVLMRYRYKNFISFLLKDNAEVTVETEVSIVIVTSKVITSLIIRNNNLTVSLNIYDFFKGWNKKEWNFEIDVNDKDILSQIVFSYL